MGVAIPLRGAAGDNGKEHPGGCLHFLLTGKNTTDAALNPEISLFTILAGVVCTCILSGTILPSVLAAEMFSASE
jgi:hypothetical protein